MEVQTWRVNIKINLKRGLCSYNPQIQLHHCRNPYWDRVPCDIVIPTCQLIKVVGPENSGNTDNEACSEEEGHDNSLFQGKPKSKDNRNGNQDNEEVGDNVKDAHTEKEPFPSDALLRS